MSDSATPWTVVHQAPLSIGFSRQEYWSGLPCPSPEDLPSPGIKPRSFTLQADSLPSEPAGKPTNTGGGSLSLLQGIFLTQESNQVSCIAGGFFTIWAATRKAPSRYNLTKMSDDKYLWSAYCPYPVFPFWETPIRVNPGHVFISLQPHH